MDELQERRSRASDLLIVSMVFRNCSEGLEDELHSRVEFFL